MIPVKFTQSYINLMYKIENVQEMLLSLLSKDCVLLFI